MTRATTTLDSAPTRSTTARQPASHPTSLLRCRSCSTCVSTFSPAPIHSRATPTWTESSRRPKVPAGCRFSTSGSWPCRVASPRAASFCKTISPCTPTARAFGSVQTCGRRTIYVRAARARSRACSRQCGTARLTLTVIAVAGRGYRMRACFAAL
ncbi:hypothetical protein AMAG_15155 [Allomyces macrogynus ATCC 38327]|uniref:Uncharacterized protein n=1 Tax=Allomyces macrogynus (strain ATCC 38327) TaxID=578462 RepID=A0A0L0T601_ALLM3|nr:hypothetical protein AMAG_15155 [Allomyces macrogynus ATCC 38327]|eukprot:KNE70187.1 hypothetical protein AMAG_15155 [Allomyces macrogynus ATCC 38327]